MANSARSHWPSAYSVGSEALNQFAVFETFVGTHADGDVHDPDSLKFVERDLPVVASAWNFSEQHLSNFMNIIPPNDSGLGGTEYIASIRRNCLFRSYENRIGPAQRDFVELLPRPYRVAIGDRGNVHSFSRPASVKYGRARV